MFSRNIYEKLEKFFCSMVDFKDFVKTVNVMQKELGQDKINPFDGGFGDSREYFFLEFDFLFSNYFFYLIYFY